MVLRRNLVVEPEDVRFVRGGHIREPAAHISAAVIRGTSITIALTKWQAERKARLAETSI